MRTITFLFLAIFTFTNAYAEVSTDEKNALLDLYYATDGDNWEESWNLNQPITTWKGVTVVDNKVVSIKLTNNNLTGELPASIGNLVHLRVLNLHNNKISGSIPNAIGNLNALVSLNLSLNKLNGSVPKEMNSMRSLEYLSVLFNDLSGAIDVQEMKLKMPKLKRLSFEGTKLMTTNRTSLASN